MAGSPSSRLRFLAFRWGRCHLNQKTRTWICHYWPTRKRIYRSERNQTCLPERLSRVPAPSNPHHKRINSEPKTSTLAARNTGSKTPGAASKAWVAWVLRIRRLARWICSIAILANNNSRLYPQTKWALPPHTSNPARITIPQAGNSPTSSHPRILRLTCRLRTPRICTRNRVKIKGLVFIGLVTSLGMRRYYLGSVFLIMNCRVWTPIMSYASKTTVSWLTEPSTDSKVNFPKKKKI